MRLESFIACCWKSHNLTTEACRVLPPDKWGWRPTDKVFTAGELICHMAYSRCWFAESAVRANSEWRPDESAGPIRSIERGLLFLSECHDYATELYGTLSDAQFEETIVTPYGFDCPRWQLAEGMIDHETHHRGQLHTYLRLLDVPGDRLAPIFHHVCTLRAGSDQGIVATGPR